jgi:hypothetical protein
MSVAQVSSFVIDREVFDPFPPYWKVSTSAGNRQEVIFVAVDLLL